MDFIESFKNQFGLSDWSTIEDISKLMKCSQETIRTTIKRCKNYFSKEEILVLKGDEIKDFNLEGNVNPKTRSLTAISPLGVGRISLLRKKGVFIENIKDYIYNDSELRCYFSDILKGKNNFYYKENGVEYFLKSTFNGLYEIKRNVSCGQYSIDFVVSIGSKNIAIECDEFGHKHYNSMKEVKRSKYIKSRGYELIRYNPDGKNDYTYLINMIFKNIEIA